MAMPHATQRTDVRVHLGDFLDRVVDHQLRGSALFGRQNHALAGANANARRAKLKRKYWRVTKWNPSTARFSNSI